MYHTAEYVNILDDYVPPASCPAHTFFSFPFVFYPRRCVWRKHKCLFTGTFWKSNRNNLATEQEFRNLLVIVVEVTFLSPSIKFGPRSSPCTCILWFQYLYPRTLWTSGWESWVAYVQFQCPAFNIVVQIYIPVARVALAMFVDLRDNGCFKGNWGFPFQDKKVFLNTDSHEHLGCS